MKFYHCAKCGTQLECYRKAVRFGPIYNLIAPHECGEVKELEEFKIVEITYKTEAKLDKLFSSFPFVDKINKANTSKPIPDKRPEESLRKELKSTAPVNLINMAKSISSSPAPGRDLEEPDHGDAD